MKTEEQATANRRVDWFAVHSHDSGFSILLRGLSMRRINAFSFYELGAPIPPLRLAGRLEGGCDNTTSRCRSIILLSVGDSVLDTLKKPVPLKVIL